MDGWGGLRDVSGGLRGVVEEKGCGVDGVGRIR